MSFDSLITWLIVAFAAIYLVRRLLTKGSGCGGCGGCQDKNLSGLVDLRKSSPPGGSDDSDDHK